jgi:predicted aldo/keto reductase-like oxidoreductase
MDRRDFLKATAAGGLASKYSGQLFATNDAGVPYRDLGSTGEKVSVVGLGGAHIGYQSEESESIRIIRTALDNGMNFLDNCWDYNGGQSEIRMGKALGNGYRKKAFVMTKIDGRDRKTAASQIDESLRRLQTDHLDLLQLHEVIRLSDPDHTFSDNGAIHAMIEAKKTGKARFLGFTGHKDPEVHLKMIKVAAAHDFAFDTVQMPLNLMDAHFDSFEKKVLPVLVEKKIGVLGMKPIGAGEILKSHAVTAVDCLRYAMSLPTSVVITGCDSTQILEQALNTARHFKPLDEKELAILLAKTAPVAKAGKYELYKTSHHFDGTYQNPKWLGPNESGETFPAA